MPRGFWETVNKTDGCWLWTGPRVGRKPRQYGGYWDSVRMHRAHRWAWEQEHGPVPPGLFVCHRCDESLCVRTDHLFLGTNRENSHDAARKGLHGHYKLTPEKAEEIRRQVKGRGDAARIARELGISRQLVSLVTTGRLWK